MKSNFSTAVSNFVSKTVASSTKQYGNIVRLSVVGAFAMGAIFTFGNTPVSPGHASTADVAVVLLAQETGTGTALGSGTGAQILAGVMKDSSLFTVSGALIIGDPANPSCVINNDGTYTGCNFTGTGFTLAAGDARYIRKAGGTMTGALTINVTGGNSTTIGLKVLNAMSGATIHAEKLLTTSGSLAVEGNTFLQSDLTLSGDAVFAGSLSVQSMSGSTFTLDSWGAAPDGSIPCKKADNSFGWREVSATGTLLPTCN